MIKMTELENGVNARLTGFSAQTLEEKVRECREGSCSCDCDPAVMAKIEDVRVTATEEGAEIRITGAVDARTLAPMMESCLLGATR